MYEVFNVRTGETVGYTSTEFAAALKCQFSSDWLDYINADEEESCLFDSLPHS